jgi:sugar O-acyltransferase (sialic acid O-acetyltransferase NeuD family)
MITLHIIGSGGLAKELINYIIDEKPQRYSIVGVWADDMFNNLAYNKYYRGSLAEAAETLQSGDNVVLSVAKPSVKRDIRKRVDQLNKLNWVTYVHPTAVVSSNAIIGAGCVITPQAIVTSDSILGEFVFMNTGSVIGHDSVVDDYCTLYPNTEVCGDCKLGSDCVMGIGAFLVPGVSLAAGTRVGAGSIVWSSFEASALLVGNPAKIIIGK